MPRGGPRLRTAEQKKNQIGQRVRERRNILNLTQDALCARLSQVSNGEWIPDRREIFRIEDGQRIVSDLEILALANALECSSCWLLTGCES
jgi:transcriptional regulator with XRE-family HTH domain